MFDADASPLHSHCNTAAKSGQKMHWSLQKCAKSAPFPADPPRNSLLRNLQTTKGYCQLLLRTCAYCHRSMFQYKA
uniref:Ovule protein n=1 Tax=Ascaris lumbricoides TaxID=6252 RepID=A0A0M3I4B8_ASCLU